MREAPPFFSAMPKRFLILLASLLLLPPYLAGKPDLIPLGPFGGDVRSLAHHPDDPERLFLGTADGQIYISRNWGETWERLVPGLGRRELVIDSLVVDPGNPDRLWAGGWELKSNKGSLYLSEDSGQSWRRIDLGIYESSVRALAVSPANPRNVAVGISEGVLLSQDGGETWERITRGYRSLYDVHSLVFDPRDPSLLYVGTWRLAWKTHDLGQNWTAVHSGMFWDSDLFSIQIDPARPNRVFAGACSGVYRSDNQGEKWARLRNGLPDAAKRTRVVRIDPTDGNIVWAGTTIGLYRSDNGGDSWRPVLPDTVINTLVIDPRDTRRIVVGTDDAGVLKSSDRGRTFQQSNHGFIARQISAVAGRATSGELFAAVRLDASHGGFFLSRDGGEEWTPHNNGLGAVASEIRAILPSERSSTVYIGTPNGIYRGTPGDGEWKPLASTKRLMVNGIRYADPTEAELLIAARQGLFRLSVTDAKLSRIKLPVYDREVLSIFADSDRAFIATEVGVFRSDDGGKSWMLKGDGMPYQTVTVVAAAGETIFAGTKGGLYHSSNGGELWRRAEGIYPIEISAIEFARDGEEIYAADPLVGFLFVSRDKGQSWETLAVGSEISRISAMSLTSTGAVLAGTVSEGVFRIEPASVSVRSQSGAQEATGVGHR